MSSCKPVARSPGCGPAELSGCRTLLQMVDVFLAARDGSDDTSRAWFGDRGVSVAQTCRRAFFALGNEDRREDHQWTYTKPALREFAERLAACPSARLAGSPTFDALYRSVEGALGLARNRKPLLVYDVARKLAYRFGQEPDAVYLHAGTRKGANALKPGLGRPRARPLDDFPTSMRTRLTPAQAGDFLCVAGKWLRPELWD